MIEIIQKCCWHDADDDIHKKYIHIHVCIQQSNMTDRKIERRTKETRGCITCGENTYVHFLDYALNKEI